ncbi:hypothetical protein BDF22DRAFT_671004 [Syncephalis plumigaleata]|nr:hypothetical protein BDF22DRAFT_671004 [Syncephalis plumigaleata]
MLWSSAVDVMARATSLAITDDEKLAFFNGLRQFQERLKTNSSQNLYALAQDIEEYHGGAGQPARSSRVPQCPKGCRHTGKNCVQNAVRGFIKSLGMSYSVKVLIGLLPALLTGKVLKNPMLIRKQLGMDTARFALFIASMVGAYKSSLYALRHLRTDTEGKNEPVNAFIAGCIAGLALLLDNNRGRRIAVALYLSTRGAQYMCTSLFNQWKVRRDQQRRELLRLSVPPNMLDAELKKKRSFMDLFSRKWAGTGLMMVTGAIIIFTLFYEPRQIPGSYLSFLIQHGGVGKQYGKNSRAALDNASRTMKRMFGYSGKYTALPHRIPIGTSSADFIRDNVPIAQAVQMRPDIHHDFVSCALEHHWTSNCTITVLFYARKKILTNPLDVIRRIVKGTVRSALFLSSYVTLAFLVPCWLRHLLQRDSIVL